MPRETKGRPFDEITDVSKVPWFSMKKLNPNSMVGYDDTDAFTDTIQHVQDEGGGAIAVDGVCILSDDVEMRRDVTLIHPAGAGWGRIYSASQHRIFITGAPADIPGFNGDQHVISGMTFDGVSLDVAPNSGDVGRGCKQQLCQFINSDRALWFGRGVFGGSGPLACQFRLCPIGIYYDMAITTAGQGADLYIAQCAINECSTAAIKIAGLSLDGISLRITDTYCDHGARFLIANGGTGDSGIYLVGCGVELCGLGPGDVALSDGYFIENNGCNIWVDGLHGFGIDASAPILGAVTTANFWNKSGTMFIRSGRQYWGANQFARIDAGTIVVYQDGIFSPGKLWGEEGAPFAHASSSGGTIVAPRAGYVGRMNKNTFDFPSGTTPRVGTMTNALPQMSMRASEAWDGNDREYEFDVVSSSIGTYNSLRILLGDGVHTPFHDLNFPLVVGGARVRMIWKMGVELEVSCTYAPSASSTIAHAAGSTPTAAEYNATVDRVNLGEAVYLRLTTADTTSIGSVKFLVFQSIAPSGTASTITISNMIERISGPHILGI